VFAAWPSPLLVGLFFALDLQLFLNLEPCVRAQDSLQTGGLARPCCGADSMLGAYVLVTGLVAAWRGAVMDPGRRRHLRAGAGTVLVSFAFHRWRPALLLLPAHLLRDSGCRRKTSAAQPGADRGGRAP